MPKVLLLALTLLILFPSVVLAQGDENITKRRPERALEIQEIREVRTEARELRSSVAENHANRLERRFRFYFTRMTNIITRFQKRLDILKAEGKDTAAVQTKLDLAKTKLAGAKLKGDEAVAAFKAIDPAKFTEQKEAAFAARDLAKAARILFQEAHQALKDALKELKTISKPALPAASSAVEQAE